MSIPVQERDRWGLGVDIGGTFTDLALLHPATGRIHVGKVLTNHKDLAAGIIDGVAGLIAGSGVDPKLVDWLASEGEKEFPEDCYFTDAHPAPANWRAYFGNLFNEEIRP